MLRQSSVISGSSLSTSMKVRGVEMYELIPKPVESLYGPSLSSLGRKLFRIYIKEHSVALDLLIQVEEIVHFQIRRNRRAVFIGVKETFGIFGFEYP